jgi:hypothetical protein
MARGLPRRLQRLEATTARLDPLRRGRQMEPIGVGAAIGSAPADELRQERVGLHHRPDPPESRAPVLPLKLSATLCRVRVRIPFPIQDGAGDIHEWQ